MLLVATALGIYSLAPPVARAEDDMMMGGGMPMGGGPPAGGMPSKPCCGMGMLDQMMQQGPDRMGAMAGMQASTLPGFPGQSHLYHIGATGFFVDHPEHIALSVEEQTRLHQLKQEALIAQADFERRIFQAEQELWLLTASDQPQIGKIEGKAREIEKLRGDQRIAFIRAVGNAATVLTEEQRKSLTGILPPSPAMPSMSMPPSPPPATPTQPPAQGSRMGHM